MPRLEDLNKKITDMDYEELIFKLQGLRQARTVAEVNNPVPARKTRKKKLDKTKADISHMTAEEKAELLRKLTGEG